MNITKNKSYFMAAIFAIAVVVSGVLANTGLAWLAITLGFLSGSAFYIYNEMTKAEKPWNKFYIYLASALVGSQIGWAALLI